MWIQLSPQRQRTAKSVATSVASSVANSTILQVFAWAAGPTPSKTPQKQPITPIRHSSDLKLSITDQYYRCSVLVWSRKSSILCVCPSLLAHCSKPIMTTFRELLKHDGKIPLGQNFRTLISRIKTKWKTLNSIDEGVRSFEVDWQTCITTDSSKIDIGFILLQKHCSWPSIKPTCGENHCKTCYAGTVAPRRYKKQLQKLKFIFFHRT